MPSLKRCSDIAISVIALILLSPFLLVIAIAIWADSGWPVLFGQVRVGLNFRPFTLWKFRSMRPGPGPLVTALSDPRITRVGRWIRRMKLDELPQFWNVLRGDMSLVGPRPEVPVYVAVYRAEFERILQVRPGVTDPASIAFRDEEKLLAASADPKRTYVERVLPAKLQLSQDYVSRSSFWLDASILVRTLAAVAGCGSGNPWPGRG